MKSLTYRSALGGALALVFSCAVGCAVDAETAAEDPAPRGIEEVDDPAEDVAEAQQEITACYQEYPHGGSLVPQYFEETLGCYCGAGYIRDSAQVWNVGNGDCFSLGWASADPKDCRVRVGVQNSGGFANGTCYVNVQQKDSRCPHDKCTVGEALASVCSPEVASICAADPFCCTNSWDSQCVAQSRTVANSLVCPEAAGSCAHTLCATGAKLTSGCDVAQANCVASICAADPFCCNNQWDSICVGQVASVCGKSCN
ncbi:hypothetical protein [Polyangium spumosum]|uniref:Lipoprotein n=1 Tax=Polyangium spumosum TaxID=889282 RepID=A0A6N7PU96_9BACT|nr:hypothetical protein [Polyangium spumosum]MRG95563.1 hypothetical protein [Polyangium spumosum]